MQVLVVYSSKTGHTKKLAEEIVKGVREVEGVECVVKAAPDVTSDDFVQSDAVIAGSPVYFGTMSAEMKALFDRLIVVRKQMGNKIGAAFATSADPTGGKETTMMSILQALLIYGMAIVGDPLDATGHYGVACTGEPDAKTAANAAKHGKRVAELMKKMRS